MSNLFSFSGNLIQHAESLLCNFRGDFSANPPVPFYHSFRRKVLLCRNPLGELQSLQWVHAPFPPLPLTPSFQLHCLQAPPAGSKPLSHWSQVSQKRPMQNWSLGTFCQTQSQFSSPLLTMTRFAHFGEFFTQLGSLPSVPSSWFDRLCFWCADDVDSSISYLETLHGLSSPNSLEIIFFPHSGKWCNCNGFHNWSCSMLLLFLNNQANDKDYSKVIGLGPWQPFELMVTLGFVCYCATQNHRRDFQSQWLTSGLSVSCHIFFSK